MYSRSWTWSLAAILALAGLSYALYLLYREAPLPEGFVYGNGYIEATEVRVSPEVGGRLLGHSLEKGERVQEGEVVARVDATDLSGRLDAARAEADTYRELLQALSAQIETWEHHLETAQRQLERARNLQSANAASQRDVEQAEDAVREARGQLDALRRQRDSMAANVEAAEAKVALAESRLTRAQVPAPISGTVLTRAVETGEVVAAGQPLAVLADLSRLNLKVFVPGSVLSRVELGAEARVRVDGLAGYHSAQINRIDDFAQFTPRDIHVPDERLRMVYGVTLRLENPAGSLKPGMPADAWIRWDASAAWPAELPVPGS